MESATKNGALWATGSRVAILIVQFGSNVVLARLLAPSEFGLIAIISAFTGFALLFTDLGLGSAIIHTDHPTEDLLASAFWLNALTGIGLTVLLSALAYPIADFYGYPRLGYLLILASLVFTLSAGTVSLALLERAMQFRMVAAVEFVSAVIGYAVALIGADRGCGAQSIIWGILAQTACGTILLWRAARWLPRTFVSRQSLGELWAFSSHLFGFNVVNYWARNLDDLLLGKFTSATSLALYNRAYGLMLLPVQQVTVSVGRVLFPSLARLRSDTVRLRAAYLRVLQMLVGIVAPLSVGLAASATAFVDVAYGSRWSGAASILAILAASGPAQVISGTVGALYRAVGQTASQFRRSLVMTAITIVAILIGLPWGATGVAVAISAKFYLLLPMALHGAWRHIDLSIRVAARELRALLFCSVLMAFAMVVCGWLLRDEAKIIVLLGQCAVGLATYVGCVAMLARPFGREILTLAGRHSGPEVDASRPSNIGAG